MCAQRGERLDFSTLVADHVANRADRHVYAGISAELSYAELVECIESARREGAQGVVVFDYSLLRPHLAALRQGVFRQDAQPPRMSWR